MSQFFYSYGLWALLRVIFGVMVLFGISACRMTRAGFSAKTAW